MKKTEEKTISLIEGLFYPLVVLNKNLKSFLLLSLFVSFIVSLTTVLVGRSFFCGLDIKDIYCTQNFLTVLISGGVAFLGIAFFYNRWQIIISENKTFREVIKERRFKKDLKTLCVVFIYILTWAVLGFCVFLLARRKPVEDWKMELLFFFCVSLVIMAAIFLLLNFVVFQHFLSGGSFFAIHKTFWAIFDGIYKPIVWFLSYLLVFAYLLHISLAFFETDKVLPVWFSAFANEFLLYFNFCFLTSVIASSLFYQEKVLFSEEE